MNVQNFLAELMKDYDVIPRTQHHVQIRTVHGMHNIFFDGGGGMKFQPCGQQKAHPVTENQLRSELKNYKYERSDLALMQRLTFLMQRIGGTTGIFCDAGFSNGRARVAIIRAHAGDYDITVRQIEAETNIHAESWAIKKAMELYPGDEPVFSDCEPAVKANQPRARWISRKENREADHFGNVRRHG